MIQHRKHQPKSLMLGDRLCINQQGINMPRALQRANPGLPRLTPCQWGRASSRPCPLGPETARSIKCLSRLAASVNLDVNLVFISNRTYAVGRFLAGAAREKSSEIQKIHRDCVSSVQVVRLLFYWHLPVSACGWMGSRSKEVA